MSFTKVVCLSAAMLLALPLAAAPKAGDLIQLAGEPGGAVGVAPAGPADLALPGMHIVVTGASAGGSVQASEGPDGEWVTLPLRGGRAPLPFHALVLSDLWPMRFRLPPGATGSISLEPDQSLAVVPPSQEPPPPLRGLVVANWGADTPMRVRVDDASGRSLPVVSVDGAPLRSRGGWYHLGTVPEGLQTAFGVDLSGSGCSATVHVSTDDGRAASYIMQPVIEALNTTPVAWPSETGGWTAYTQLGAPIQDMSAADKDPSTGGTTPQGENDIVRGASPYYPSALYAFDATNQVFFYRVRLAASPLTSGGQGSQSTGNYTGNDPFTGTTWNLLVDTDGDGYKEFTVVLDGNSGGGISTDISASAGAKDGDDLKVYYNNLASQGVTTETVSNDLVTVAGDLVWWGNAGTKNATVPPNPAADGATWDYGRTRCVYHTASSAWGEGWFLDFQFPLSALTDAWNSGNGGRQLVGINTPISFGYSTSSSNVNPLQKDFASSYSYTASETARFPYSDVVTLATGITQFPQVGSMSLSNIVCPTRVTVSATVADALQVSPPNTGSGVVTDTIASVTFQFYADLNGNGLPDDGSTWTNMAIAGSSLNPDTRGDLAPDGLTASFNDWGVVWNTSPLSSGQYLIRVIAVDDQSNTTTKTVGSYVVDTSGTGCRQGINASWNSYSDASHLVQSSLFSNTPAATVYMNGSFAAATTYNVAYYDSTGALISYSQATSDTFGTMLSSNLILTSTSPPGTYHSVVYPLSFMPPSTYNGTYNATTNPLLADCPFTVLGPPAPVVTSPIVEGDPSISGTSTAPVGTTITVYQNGVSIGTTTVQSGGTWTLTGVTGLAGGDSITAKAGTGTGQGPVSNTVIVTPKSTPPIVTASLLAGASQTISGSSVEAAGSTITVYIDGVPLATTTTVQADGSWSLAGVTLSAGQVVTAKVQAPGESQSGPSNAVTVAANSGAVTPVPVITVPIGGIIAGATSVSGTTVAAAGVTVNLYADGVLLGTTATTDASGNWTIGSLAGLPNGTILAATATRPGNGTSDWSAPVIVGTMVDMLRSDLLTSLSQAIAPCFTRPWAPASCSMDPLGAKHLASWGEGPSPQPQSPGTADADQAYLHDVHSDDVDTDPTVLSDNGRPLVFYELLDNNAHTLYLKKSGDGTQIVFTIDAP